MLAYFVLTARDTAPSFTSAFVNDLLRHLLLDCKIIGMKFKKHIIVSSETINGTKIFVCLWDMKDIS